MPKKLKRGIRKVRRIRKNPVRRTIFFPPKFPALARKISITSPAAFKKSIEILKKNGLTLREKRALVLAQNRARVQLKRKTLSARERREFTEISKIKIPKVTKKR